MEQGVFPHPARAIHDQDLVGEEMRFDGFVSAFEHETTNYQLHEIVTIRGVDVLVF